MKVRKNIVLILFVLLVTNYLQAQNIKRIEVINVDDGLAQSTVFDIIQDSRGYMWFGTEDGLSKYDGYNFTNYMPDINDTLSLPNNYIYCLYEDSDNDLWIGTRSGLAKLNRDKNNFTTYKIKPTYKGDLQNNYIYSIHEDSHKNLWVGTFGAGLALFEKETGAFKIYPGDSTDNSGLSENLIRDIHEDVHGNIWVATDSKGLNLYKPGEDKFITFEADSNDKYSLPSNNLYSITHSSRNGEHYLWVGTRNGLGRLYLKKGKEYTPQNTNFYIYQSDSKSSAGDNCLPNNYVYDVIEDRKGQIWIGTRGGGIAVIDNKEGLYERFTILQYAPEKQYSISNDHIFKLYEDKSGIIWIGSLRGGLNKYIPGKERFKHYPFFKTNPIGNKTLSFYEDEKRDVWVGTRGGGITKFSFSEQPIKEDYNESLYNIMKYNEIKRKEYQIDKEDDNRFNKNDVYFISKYHFDNNKLILGTSGGLYLLNKKSGKIDEFKITNFPKDNYGAYAYCLHPEIRKDTIIYWIGTARGLAKIIIKTKENTDRSIQSLEKKIVLFSHVPNNPKSISHNTVYVIFEDKKHEELWIGTRGGGLNVFKYNEPHNQIDSTAVFVSYKKEYNNKKSLPHNDIMAIYEDRNKTRWIGTRGGGFVKVVRKNDNTLSFINVCHALENKVIYDITEDKGFLWLITGNGLSKFDMHRKSLKRYNSKDGIMRPEFNLGAMLKCRDGKIIFPGVNGFNLFFPDKIRNIKYQPQVDIVSFMLFNNKITPDQNSVLSKDISETKKIILQYHQNFISFEFVALDYTARENNNYAYQLVAFEDDTVNCGTRRFANYTNLSPGKYTFRVTATNSDKIWNDDYARLDIEIIPPFWEKTYFIIFAFIVAIAAVIAFYKLRTRTIKKQKRVLEKQVEERTAKLNSYMKSLKKEVEEHRKTEKELIKAKHDTDEAYRAKSDFLASISHDIRTPMNSILGFTLMLDKITEDSKQKSYLDTIKESGKTLLQLINDILDMSKIEAGRLDMNYETIDIRAIFHDVEQTFSLQAMEKGIELRHVIDENVPDYLIIDEIRLKQVLFNLISNAIKFTQEGYIEVSIMLIGDIDTEKHTCNIQITVKDTGLGIPKDQQQGIFEAFVQRKNQKAKHFGGTGLGLAITKQLTHLMKGHITLESTENEGSSFIINLFNIGLSSKNEMINEKTEGLVNPALIDFEESKILIADDSESNRNLLMLMLSETNIQYIEAVNGHDAIKKAIEHKPNLVLLDLLMPEMDGFEAIERFKSNPALKEIRVIAVTASVTKETKEKVEKLNFDGFIGKPVDKSALFKELTKYLKHKIRKDEDVDKMNVMSFDFEPVEISHEAYDKLQTDIMPLWRSAEQSNSISKIKDFNETLISFINRYEIYELSHFSKLFNENTSSLDIEKLENLLKRFPDIVKNLKKNK